MKGRTPLLVKQGFEIDLIHQHTRTYLRRYLTYMPYRCFICEGATWIMKVAENDETHVRRNLSLQFVNIHAEAPSCRAFKATHFRSQVIENCQQRVIGGLLNQHLIAGSHQRRECYVVRHGCAECIDNAI